MFKKFLIALTTFAMITALFTGCSESPATESQPAENAEQTSAIETSTSATTETEVASTPVTEAEIPHIRVREQANKIASEFMDELKLNVQNVDYDAFDAMFDRNNPLITDELIKENWDFFNQYFVGENVYNIDCETTAYSDTQILFDIFLHWGTSNQTSFSYSTYPLYDQYLIYNVESNKWLWSTTETLDDDIINQLNTYYINSYGENEYRNGWCVNNYEVKHNKALSEQIYICVKSVVINDDESLDLTLAIVNGMNFSKNIYQFEGKLYVGSDNNNMKEIVDFSNEYGSYVLGSAPSNTVKLIKINVPKENLVNPVEKSDLVLINDKTFSFSWIN